VKTDLRRIEGFLHEALRALDRFPADERLAISRQAHDALWDAGSKICLAGCCLDPSLDDEYRVDVGGALTETEILAGVEGALKAGKRTLTFTNIAPKAEAADA
jgi:hypothetical protein